MIYADPPYDYDQYDELLMSVDTNLALAPEAVRGRRASAAHRALYDNSDTTAVPAPRRIRRSLDQLFHYMRLHARPEDID